MLTVFCTRTEMPWAKIHTNRHKQEVSPTLASQITKPKDKQSFDKAKGIFKIEFKMFILFCNLIARNVNF